MFDQKVSQGRKSKAWSSPSTELRCLRCLVPGWPCQPHNSCKFYNFPTPLTKKLPHRAFFTINSDAKR